MFVSSVIFAVICLIIMAVAVTLAVVLSSKTRGKKSSMWHPIQVLGVKGQERRVFDLWLFEVVCGLFLGMFKYSQKQECIPVGCLPPAFWPYPSMHCRGECLPGGICPGGVYPGGCLPRGYVYPSMQWDRPLLWTDRHLWKHNLRKLRLRVVKREILAGRVTRWKDGINYNVLK